MAIDFLSLGIRQELTDFLRQSGISEPTPVQAQAIPVLVAGKDLVAQSQTGTGKTLAFLLPILEKIKPAEPRIQALILAPTRELASQITKEAGALADKLGLKVLSVYGGQDVERQVKKLEGNPHMVIGTPGRLLDHLGHNTIDLSGVSRLVLDEADQMLHMGFLDDVEKIIRQTSTKRQTMLFSATMPAKVRALAKRYMKQPVDIDIQASHVTLDEIRQMAVQVAAEPDKLPALCSMIDAYNPYLALVFCHSKQRAVELGTALAQRGYKADELHGDLSPAKRTQVMKRFSDATLQILVASDIAARGLDIEGITHVFNYDVPRDVDTYIHRIGRTGRAGETGIAVTLVTPQEQTYLRQIEHGIRFSLEKYRFNGKQVVAKSQKPPRRQAVSPKRDSQGPEDRVRGSKSARPGRKSPIPAE